METLETYLISWQVVICSKQVKTIHSIYLGTKFTYRLYNHKMSQIVLSAFYYIYYLFSDHAFPILFCLVMGAWSDKHGRKPLLLSSLVSQLSKKNLQFLRFIEPICFWIDMEYSGPNQYNPNKNSWNLESKMKSWAMKFSISIRQNWPFWKFI